MKNDITISAPLHFDKTAPILARMTDYGDNWPTVYIINNDKEVYIGERKDTLNCDLSPINILISLGSNTI